MWPSLLSFYEVQHHKKMLPLTQDVLDKLLKKCDEAIKDTNDRIEKLEEQKQDILAAHNDLSDKMSFIFDTNKEISEFVLDNNWLEDARSFFCFLSNIIDSAELYKNEKLDVTPKKYVYAGIEVSMHPTVNDIA